MATNPRVATLLREIAEMARVQLEGEMSCDLHATPEQSLTAWELFRRPELPGQDHDETLRATIGNDVTQDSQSYIYQHAMLVALRVEALITETLE